MPDPGIGRREFGALAAAAAALAIAPRVSAATSEDERLAAFFESVFERDLARSPIRRSRLGIKTGQNKWDDISEAAHIEDATLTRGDLEALQGFNRSRLSPQSDLSWRVFEHRAGQQLRQFEWRRNTYLVTQMGGMHTRVPITLIGSHPIETRPDAEAYIARLEGVEPLMVQLVEELQRQEAAGVKTPQFVYALTIEPSENLLQGHPFDNSGTDSPLFADFAAKLEKTGWPADERAALTTRAEAALSGPFARGYRRLVAHLRSAQATATDEAGVWKLPDGAKYYEFLLEAYTTLPRKADDLHELGLREVAKIHEAMRAIMHDAGFEGGLQAFFAHMRTNPRFYYPDTEDGRSAYLERAETLLEEIKARQHEILETVPEAGVIVRAVEPWREKSAAKAFYKNPPLEGDEPGIFYVNLYDMAAQPGYQLPVLLYHEAIPGHHTETVIAHRLEGIPRFRKFASIAAFSEGWSLYAERLAKEMGLYRDPYDDFGRLSLQLMRATRLVVDTGLHAKRWSRERAIAYLDRTMPSSHYDNRREVERYIALPGQATSYYVGMMKIAELRERARSRLGERFDIRRFHETVLGNGPLPLSLLEEIVNAWIVRQLG